MQAEQTPFRTVVRPAEPVRIDSVHASGLPDAFLVELLLRHFSRMGELRLFEISQRLGVEFDTEAVDFMIDRLHPSYEQAYLPCIPYDVISKIRDRALSGAVTPSHSRADRVGVEDVL